MAVSVVVIGGGPADVEAARAAASSGAVVALVCDEAIGGRAGWHWMTWQPSLRLILLLASYRF